MVLDVRMSGRYLQVFEHEHGLRRFEAILLDFMGACTHDMGVMTRSRPMSGIHGTTGVEYTHVYFFKTTGKQEEYHAD
jgi:hypothetical protein